MRSTSMIRMLGGAVALVIGGSAALAQPYQQWPAAPLAPGAPFWVPSLHIYETFPQYAPFSLAPSILLQLEDNIAGAYNFLFGAAQWGVATPGNTFSAISTPYISMPGFVRRSDVVYNAQDAEDLIFANLSIPFPGNTNDYAIRFSTTPPGAVGYPADVERMTILSNGNVGIGNVIPPTTTWIEGMPNTTGLGASFGAVLEVYDKQAATTLPSYGGIGLGSFPGVDFSVGKKTISAAKTYFQVRAQNGTELLTIDQTGKTGIGTNAPVNRFDVSGASVIGSGYAGTNTAPANGLLVQGPTYIGTTADPGGPGSPFQLVVQGTGFITAGVWSASDMRLKEKIAPIDNALSKVIGLQGVHYQWRRSEFADRNLPEGTELGFIAQDLEKVVPEVVRTGSDGFKRVSYSNLTALLAEAIKEQQKSIGSVSTQTTDLKSENAKLTADNQALHAQLDEQATRIARLELAMQKLAETFQAKQSLGSSSSSAKEAQLFQNDPNPFSESTTIGYYLPPTVAHAELIVYSAASGKEMLRQTIIGTGSGKLVVNGRDLGSGTYYYTMLADGATVHGKSMIVVK